MPASPVIFCYSQNKSIIRIQLNRPEVRNAVNQETMERLESILDEIEASETLRVIILTGAGEKAFCSGGDLNYFATLKDVEAALQMSNRMQAILNRFYRGKCFVIAEINGDAVGGGCEILTACHHRIASRATHFQFPHAIKGLSPGWGGGLRALNQLGISQATRLMLTAARIDCQEAYRINLIHEIVEPEDLKTRVQSLAEQIVGFSQTSMRGMQRLIQSFVGQLNEDLVSIETRIFGECWQSPAFQETLRVHKEKKK